MQLYVCSVCVSSILIFQQNQKWRCKTHAAICQICHTLTLALTACICMSAWLCMSVCICVCVCESALCSGFLNLHVNSIARTWKCILALLLLLLLPLHAELLLLLLLHFNKFMILFAFLFFFFFCTPPSVFCRFYFPFPWHTGQMYVRRLTISLRE